MGEQFWMVWREDGVPDGGTVSDGLREDGESDDGGTVLDGLTEDGESDGGTVSDGLREDGDSV